jgi:hypothetical protein
VIPNPTINGTVDGVDDGWDFGNGTMISTQGAPSVEDHSETEYVGTIRPGKGSEARVFERDVQSYQMQPSLEDVYTTEGDDRRRTFIVNDDIPEDFEEVSLVN